jgi:hypothetical protein
MIHSMWVLGLLGLHPNKARVYALPADARGRLNTAFMTCAYAGGSAGSGCGPGAEPAGRASVH